MIKKSNFTKTKRALWLLFYRAEELLKDTSVKTTEFNKELIDAQSELRIIAYRLTANKDKAEDLVQETFLRVLDNREKYKDNTNFRGWIFTIMKNIFINEYRKESHKADIIDFENKASMTEYDCEFICINTEHNLYNKEIHGILNALARYHRRPFLLYVSGYKYHEIAQRLKIPIGTVKSRIYSTKQLLKKQLRDFRN